MKRILYIATIISSMFFLCNCTSNNFEEFYLEEISKDSSLVEFFKVVDEFEDYLLMNHFIKKIDKNNYKTLMTSAINDEIVLIADAEFYKKVEPWAFIENIGFGQSSFIGAFDMWDGKIDTTSTAYKLCQFQKEMNRIGDLADSKLNISVMESLDGSDFAKSIYRAPFTYIIFQILQQNYSDYHKWLKVDNVYFHKNVSKLDFENSNQNNLDALCSRIISEKNTKFYFLALGIDGINDTINYDLSVERTNYIENYLIKNKGLPPNQIIATHINRFKAKYGTYKNLYEKEKGQLYFYTYKD